VKVLGRVPVLGVIATADMSTGPAQPQVYPGVAALQALLAALSVGNVSLYQLQMSASSSHAAPPVPVCVIKSFPQRRRHCIE
jgi:hypothetical protein